LTGPQNLNFRQTSRTGTRVTARLLFYFIKLFVWITFQACGSSFVEAAKFNQYHDECREKAIKHATSAYESKYDKSRIDECLLLLEREIDKMHNLLREANTQKAVSSNQFSCSSAKK